MRKVLKSRLFIFVVFCLIATAAFFWIRSYAISRFEAARDQMVASFAKRMGVSVSYKSLTRHGFSSLVLTDLKISLPDSPVESPLLTCARAEATANLWALVQGEPSLRNVNVFDPKLYMVISLDGGLLLPAGLKKTSFANNRHPNWPSFFRAGMTMTIRGGTLTLDDLARSETLSLENVQGRFSSDATPRVNLLGDITGHPLAHVSLKIADQSDKIDLHLGSLPSELVDTWLLGKSNILSGGDMDADLSLRMPRAGDLGLRGSVEFHRVRVKDAPDYLPLFTGTATIDMTRRQKDSTYTFRRIDIVTDAVEGSISGSLTSSNGKPTGSITATVTKFPFDKLFCPELVGRIQNAKNGCLFFGQGTSFTFDLPLPLDAVLPAGHMTSPNWRFAAATDDGSVGLEFGDTQASWNRSGAHFSGSTTVSSGQIEIAKTKEMIEVKRATLDMIDGHRLQVGNIHLGAVGGDVAGFGSVEFADTVSVDGSFDAKSVDAVRFGRVIGAKNVFVAGRCDVQGRVQGTPSDLQVSANLNLDQTELRWSHWFEKKIGTSAGLTADYYYKKDGIPRLDITSATMDQVSVSGSLLFNKTHRPQSINLLFEADSPEKIGAVFRLPIDLAGRGDASFSVDFDRARTDRPIKLVGRGAYVESTPAGTDKPVLSAKDVVFTAWPGSYTENRPTDYSVTASFADIPDSLNDMKTWVAAFKSPNKTNHQHLFNLSLHSGTVCCGTADADSFNATFSAEQDALVWHKITMTPYKGRLTAHWSLDRATNKYVSDTTWENVELSPFLKWAFAGDVGMNGTFSGKVDIEGSSGNPTARKGNGYLDVTNGTIDPVYLTSKLGFSNGNPPKETTPIQFDRFHTSMNIDGDKIFTPDITIDKKGVKFSGAGWTSVSGDAEYNVEIVLAPQVVNEIPALHDKLLVDVPEFLQRDLPLRFAIQRKGGEISSSYKVDRVEVDVLNRTVDVGTQTVKTGKKIIQLPAQILYDVLKYLPGMKRTNGQ